MKCCVLIAKALLAYMYSTEQMLESHLHLYFLYSSRDGPGESSADAQARLRLRCSPMR